MRKENSQFVTGFLSEAGTFIHNRDYFAYTELDDLACWVVAKGLDTDQEIASAELAVKSILGKFIEKPAMSRRKIKNYLREAHRWLQEESVRVRLKASIVVVVTNYSKIIWAGAGNARVYHFRNGRLNFKSKDQSLAQAMADAEKIPDDIDGHEERHNLLNYLGQPNEFEPFVSKKTKLLDGDVLLLCTSGLWEGVHSAEMLDALEEAKEPEEFVDTLEEVLLSKQQAIVPNYTGLAIFANKIYQEDSKKKIKTIKRVVLALIVAVVLGGGAFIYMARDAAKKAEDFASIFEYEQNGDAFIQEDDYEKALKEYSEGRNAAKRVKDPIHRDTLGKKLRITQLIIDGDTFVQEGQYAKAVGKYETAISEAKLLTVFDKKKLEEKIEQAESYQQIMDWVKEGDLRFDKEEYLGAKEMYQKARKASLENSFTSGEKEIKAKLEEVEDKISGFEKEQLEMDADKLEKKGDLSVAELNLEEAMLSYAQAQEIYQDLGLMAKALNMERKMMKVEEKLNPIPTEDGAANLDLGDGGESAGDEQSVPEE